MRTVPPSLSTREPRSSRSRHRLGVIASLSPGLVLAIVAWPHLGDAARGWQDVIGSGGREPPLIKAPREPVKVSASADPTHQQADTIRQMLDGGQSWDVGVEMLPEPEGPILMVAPGQDGGDAVVAEAEPASEPQGGRLELELPPPIIRQARHVATEDDRDGSSSPLILRAGASRESAPPQTIYRIQIAAMPTREAAHEVWKAYRLAHADAFDSLRPVIEHVETDAHSFFRVQAGDLPTLAEAKDLCEDLSRRGIACVVVRR